MYVESVMDQEDVNYGDDDDDDTKLVMDIKKEQTPVVDIKKEPTPVMDVTKEQTALANGENGHKEPELEEDKLDRVTSSDTVE